MLQHSHIKLLLFLSIVPFFAHDGWEQTASRRIEAIHHAPATLDELWKEAIDFARTEDDSRLVYLQQQGLDPADACFSDGRRYAHQLIVDNNTVAALFFIAHASTAVINSTCQSRPLHWAAYRKNHPLIEALLKYGACVNNLDNCGKTALDETTDAACTELLRAHGAITGNDVLARLIPITDRETILEAINHVFESSINDDPQSPRRRRWQNATRVEISHYLEQHNITRLSYSELLRLAKVFKGSAAPNLSTHAYELELLKIGLHLNSVPTLKRALGNYVTIHDATDSHTKMTALHEAALYGNTAIIYYILTNKLLPVDVCNGFYRTSNWAPICYTNETPLHFAARYSQHHAIRLLLAHGARVNLRNGAYETPLDWAKDPESIKILREHDGKTGKELLFL